MAFQSRMAVANKKKQQITEVKTTGSSFIVPAGVTKMLVTAIGGGGGGGFAYASRIGTFSSPDQCRATAAGGAGGSSESRYFAVSPGQPISYLLGSGGVGGITPATLGSGGIGGTGGNTTCTISGVTITGRGGGGGGSVQNSDGFTSPAPFDVVGAGGLLNGTSNGIPNVAPRWVLLGGNGGVAQRSLVLNSSDALVGNSGGGAAGTLVSGTSSSSSSPSLGGSLYGGSGAAGVSTGALTTNGAISSFGNTGSLIGGGGSGGAVNVRCSPLTIRRTASANGGSGAAGGVIITYWKR
jgi:hypothetical protein